MGGRICHAVRPRCILGCCSIFLWLFSSRAAAQFNLIYNFTGGPSDGQYPIATLVSDGTDLYGATTFGGTNNFGTIFELNPGNDSVGILHSFSKQEAELPEMLLLSGSVLYGTAQGGGTSGAGTLFSFNLNTDALNVLHSFAGLNDDGSSPYNQLLLSGSTIYGMAELGGIGSGGSTGFGNGTIFSYGTNNAQFTNLHFFAGGTSDGRDPYFNGFNSNGGNIYGMTNAGGVYSSGSTLGGTIFSFNPTSSAVTVLHSFARSSSDADAPIGALVGSGSILYGVTLDGGSSGDGTIFAFNTSTDVVTVLHSFMGGSTDGSKPSDSLMQSGSMLYGTTSSGGSFGDGTVFSYDTNTDLLSVLHSFDGLDGIDPWGGLSMLGNTLYGTTDGGGSAGDGVVYDINLPEPAVSGSLILICGISLMRRTWRGSPRHVLA